MSVWPKQMQSRKLHTCLNAFASRFYGRNFEEWLIPTGCRWQTSSLCPKCLWDAISSLKMCCCFFWTMTLVFHLTESPARRVKWFCFHRVVFWSKKTFPVLMTYTRVGCGVLFNSSDSYNLCLSSVLSGFGTLAVSRRTSEPAVKLRLCYTWGNGSLLLCLSHTSMAAKLWLVDFN